MKVPYTFIVKIQNAQHVNVVGDFNQWQTTADSLERIGDDLWQATLYLNPGHYKFAYFVIDSRWQKETPAGVNRTRLVNSGSWARVSGEHWSMPNRPIELSPTESQLSAA